MKIQLLPYVLLPQRGLSKLWALLCIYLLLFDGTLCSLTLEISVGLASACVLLVLLHVCCLAGFCGAGQCL